MITVHQADGTTSKFKGVAHVSQSDRINDRFAIVYSEGCESVLQIDSSDEPQTMADLETTIRDYFAPCHVSRIVLCRSYHESSKE